MNASGGLFIFAIILFAAIFGVAILSTVAIILARVFLRPRRLTHSDLNAPPQWSADGHWWWDGTKWVPRQ